MYMYRLTLFVLSFFDEMSSNVLFVLKLKK